MKEIIRKNYKKFIFAGLALVAVIAISRYFYARPGEKNAQKKDVKTVGVAELKSVSSQDELAVQGVVKADSKVDVVAMANGTVKRFDLKIGGKVLANQPVAELYDNVLLTNLMNAGVNASNVSQNYLNASKVADESVNQAKLGLSRAEEGVVAAEIGVKSAKDAQANSRSLIEKNRLDIRGNAAIACSNFLNTIESYLDQANYLIKAEGNEQLPGVSLTLSAEDGQSLVDAKTYYLAAKRRYDSLSRKNIAPDESMNAINEILKNLDETKKLADKVVDVLEATVPHSQFTESALSAQKASFAGLRSTIINTQTAAQGTMQSLQNFELTSKQQLDGASNAVKAAESQLAQAKLALDSSRSGAAGAEKSRQQQLDLARTSLDGAQGQYRLLSEQADDLTVKAPIAGEVTAKLVEIGTEVRIGQKIAEISKVDSVKIIASLGPEDALRIKLGQSVTVNGRFKGVVNQVNPAADPSSKKIQVEVVYDNKNKDFIPETLVDLSLPLKPVGPSGSGVYRLPLKVLTIGQNENFIFIAENGRAKKINITLDRIDGESAYVRTDLPGDTKVIIDGNKMLEDGEEITIER